MSIWSVAERDGVLTVTIGVERAYFDRRIDNPDVMQRKLPLILSRELGFTDPVSPLLSAARAGYKADLQHWHGEAFATKLAHLCVELGQAELSRLRAGDPYVFQLRDVGGSRDATIVLYVGSDEPELADRFVRDGVVTARDQIRGLGESTKADPERLARLRAASTLPEHEAREILRISVKRPWWRFWA